MFYTVDGPAPPCQLIPVTISRNIPALPSRQSVILSAPGTRSS